MAVLDDHDQRFKGLLREFFADFMRLFFAEWAARLDFSHVDWLEQEQFPDPPDGSRHVLDLVAKVHTTEPLENTHPDTATCLLLVHIEIESVDRTTNIKPRLPYYYLHLLDRHQTPVLPIVVYLKVGLDGIGTDTITFQTGPLTVLTMTYLYVGLPSLPAEEYVRGANWLGVALSALMKVPPERVAWLGAQALRRLEEAELTQQQQFLLAECVHNYLPMEDEQSAEFERMMSADPKRRAEYMKKTLARRAYDEGLEKGVEQGRELGREQGLEQGRELGREQGREVGRRAILLELAESLLANRFGATPPDALQKLQQLDTEQLKALVLAIPMAATPAELGL